MKNYRHGDLMVKEISELPKQLKKLNHNVLAHGESGHRHVVVADRPASVELLESIDGKTYMKVLGGNASLTHEEHKTITITPGFYVVEHETEFDYFQAEIKRVRD